MTVQMRIFRQVGLALVVVLLGCAKSEESLPEGHESQSVVSPEGLMRAFVWVPALSGGLGATVSQPYQVWVEDVQFASKRLMLEADKTDGLRISWVSGQTLEVCYSSAQIFKFLNRFDFAIEGSPTIRSIEVMLRRVEDLSEC